MVTWPNQTKTVKRNLDVNQTIQIAMNEASLPMKNKSKKEEIPYFSNTTDTFGIEF